MHCHLAKRQIKLTELAHVECGGSCQIDINAGEVSCSEQECCEYSGNGEILKNLKDEKDGVYKNYLYFFQLNGFYK